ncbi:MAG: DUF58 domain-containing protein [Anaerolineae bacterium]|nr:DUF58 domain-containing protein [Anaerolineae bacterium]
MNTFSRLIITLILVIFVVGLAALNSNILALTIPLMVYLFAAIALRPEGVAVEVTRTFTPDRASQDTPVTVQVKLLNVGSAVSELTVQDILPQGATVLDGESSTVIFLAKNAALDLTYTITAPRGEYANYETSMCAGDALGLFEQSFTHKSSRSLVIHPRYPKLDRIKIRPPQTRGFAGPIAARQGGSGINFWSVREYQANDPKRQINWRLSARAERELYTNVFEQERVADVGLILDARVNANVLTTSESLFEHSVRATAALAENFLNDGNRVSLLVYGAGLARVFPGYGRIQHNRILRELSRAEPSINYALESLNHLPTGQFPAKSQIVIISPLLPEDITMLRRMRAHGYAVIVVSPDPISYEATRFGDTTSLAYRLASAERRLMLRQMRQCGVQLVNWQVHQPLEHTIREMLAAQPLTMHYGLQS